jgi:hypothetical protein
VFNTNIVAFLCRCNWLLLLIFFNPTKYCTWRHVNCDPSQCSSKLLSHILLCSRKYTKRPPSNDIFFRAAWIVYVRLVIVSTCVQVCGWAWCHICTQKGSSFKVTPTAVNVCSKWYPDNSTPCRDDSESQSAFISPETGEGTRWDVWVVAFIHMFAPFTDIMVQHALWHIWGVQDL